MSVGVFPLQSAEAVTVVTELEKVFGPEGKTPLAGMFRFMPLEAQNAVMVITPQPKYLTDVEAWIGRMDAGGEGTRLYVYEVKYVKAVDLSEQLGNVYGSTSTTSTSEPSLMPSMDPVEVRTTDMPPADAALPTNGQYDGAGTTDQTLTVGDGEVGISAVEESNSLLVRASPGQWESIRQAIERLDTMPLQVHIEAQVIEVKLTGDLSYGVSWYFGNSITPAVRAITDTLDDWTNSGTSMDATPAAPSRSSGRARRQSSARSMRFPICASSRRRRCWYATTSRPISAPARRFRWRAPCSTPVPALTSTIPTARCSSARPASA